MYKMRPSAPFEYASADSNYLFLSLLKYAVKKKKEERSVETRDATLLVGLDERLCRFSRVEFSREERGAVAHITLALSVNLDYH